ncbi:MAG: type II toxin-antitoxin system HicB family antitoxin [Firmicutes bacterium]|nr:type II toxin-antitoxin system HicB family antitoxin [Bacillota bacterium]
MQYSVIIEYDEIDKIYIASVPELKGCMAHGNTREEAVREVQVAMELYLEVV